MKNLIISLFAVLVSCSFARAQVIEHYYKDTENKEGGSIADHLKYQNSIIICGKGFEKTKYQPMIIRLDTLGNTIWNTADNDFNNYNGHLVIARKLMMGMDGYLYASVFDASDTKYYLWKVDPATGIILMRGLCTASLGSMIDYDYFTFISVYSESYNGSTYHVVYSFIDKSDGSTVETYVIGDLPWSSAGWGFTMDNQQNIYYSKEDTVIKVQNGNLNNILWKHPYGSVGVDFYEGAYYDSITSSVIFMGHLSSGSEHGTIAKINTSNGSLGSYAYTQAVEVNLRDYKYFNGNLYCTWEHIYVGGVMSDSYVTSYNIAGGGMNWNSGYNFNTGGQEAALSLDIDPNSNVYATGYYASNGYGPSKWGIMKVNGSGTVMYHKKIDTDTNSYDGSSCGYASCVINNKPYFVGQLQSSSPNKERLTFIKMDPVSGIILIKKPIGGGYVFPSKTLYIENYGSSNTLVMKQSGRMVKLEMYNYYKQLIWENTYSKEYYLCGGNLAIRPNGDIFFSAYTKTESYISPYYNSTVDSMFVFHISSIGNVIKTYSFCVGSADAAPVELCADNASTLFFYRKSTTIYYRKIAYPVMSAEYNSSLYSNGMIPSITRNCVNKNSAKAFLFGYYISGPRLLEINKTTMVQTILAVLPNALRGTDYLLETDTNKVLLCGSSYFGYESIGLYNTTLLDTIWTRTLTTNVSTMLMCVTDPHKDYVYTASHNSQNITIRKIAVANGTLKWSYTYNGIWNGDDAPIDMTYDTLRNQLLIAGYEENSFLNRVLILTLDTAGIAIDTIVKAGDFSGDNYALCTHVLHNGTQWAGGNLNKNPYGQAGFIYELALGPCSPSSSIQNIHSCIPYSWNGNIYYSTGTYTDTISNLLGCDSIMTLNLTMYHLDTTVTLNGQILNSNATGCSYQWVNCNNNYSLIGGAINQSYNIPANGNYAVIVTQGACKDTSNCIAITNFGLNEESLNGFALYPNPSGDRIVIKTSSEIKNGIILVYGIRGELLLKQPMQSYETKIDISALGKGVYIVRMIGNDINVSKRIIKE